MPKSRIILVLGVVIALLPLLGFPRGWESFFQVFAGLAIVILSVWTTIDKKLMFKHKARERSEQRRAPQEESPSKEFDASGRRVTDFYPRTAPPGRRLSDINPTTGPNQEESE